MTTYKTTADITFRQPCVIQQWMTGANQFGDVAPVDTQLVFEHGIWKYPQQATGGRVQIPATEANGPSCMVRLYALYAAFGASASYTLQVMGNPDNTSNEPYPSASAALYREGTMVVASGTTTTNLALQGNLALIMPGQKLVLISTAGSAALARFYFAPVRAPFV
jgi:hypothetical protein